MGSISSRAAPLLAAALVAALGALAWTGSQLAESRAQRLPLEAALDVAAATQRDHLALIRQLERDVHDQASLVLQKQRELDGLPPVAPPARRASYREGDRLPLDRLSREARVVPNFVNGKTNGFKIFGIRVDSVLRDVGFLNNDVLVAVNGDDLSNTELALEIYGANKDKNEFTLDILRDNQPMTLHWSVPGTPPSSNYD